MPKSKIILSIGVVVALLPALGFPHSWESFFQVFAGLSIVLLSIWARIDRKLKLQAKAHMRQIRKSSIPPVVSPGIVPPVTNEFGKRITDFSPKTGQPGRRLSDINPIIEPPSSADDIRDASSDEPRI